MTSAVRDHPRPGKSLEPLAGVGALTRFFLRRDRIKLPAWVAGLALFVIYIGTALPTIAPDKQSLESMVTLFAEPVGRMFTGPAYGMDAPSYERFFATGYAPYLFVLAALMNIFLVIRHTRAEEQSGRAELIRASVTGRFAPLTASLLVAVITNLIAGTVVAAVAIAAGFAAPGSILIGAGTALTGLVFAGIAAVTAQLSEFARTASGLAGIVLGVSFALRALGDMAQVGGSALSWISPLGWASQTAPYVLDRWAPLALLLALTALCVIAAYFLQGQRDFGASLITVRPGPAHARSFLGRPLGLAMRIQRSNFLGWGMGILALGIVDGAFTQALVDAGQNMPDALKDLFGADQLVNGYLAFLGLFVSVLVTAYTISAMQTVRSEETQGRADLVLATATTRTAWLGSHVATVALGAITISVLTGFGTGIAAAFVTGDWSLVGDALGAHVALLPAVLALLAFWTLLIGCAPRLLSPLGWAIVVFVSVLALFAELLDLPQWLVSASPFEHLAQVPQEPFAPAAALILLALAALISAIGLAGVRRREINAV